MNGAAAKEKNIHPTTSGEKAPVPNAGEVSSEGKAARRDAFWAGALESASILLWIVTHLPNPEQYPFQ